MATKEKNQEIKLINLEEQGNSINRYNNSASNEDKEDDKVSLKISGEDNKDIENINIISQNQNSNSKTIKEKSEELDNNPNNNSKQSEKNSSNKSQTQNEYNSNNVEEKEEYSNKEGENSRNSERKENDDSSFLNGKYDNNVNENNELNESKNKEGKNPFMSTGKFMQIQPHFNIFSKRIDTLRDSIYENTKKCLIYKSSLQYSENLMREKANSIVKEMVEKIYNIRQMFLDSDKEIKGTINDTNNLVLNLKEIQDINKKDLNECQLKISKCENQIGYKLLGKPNYSFMKKTYNNMNNALNNKI